MAGHSLLSPSSAHRWMACPGSVALAGDHGGGGNVHAAEGTVAHWVAEESLRSGKDAAHLIGTVRTIVDDEDASQSWTFTVDQEMADFVQMYINYVRRRADELMTTPQIEYRVVLDDVLGVPDSGGTADTVLSDPLINGALEVVDLKYGFGAVEADDNPQLLLYAAGVLSALEAEGAEFETVTCTIVQPRLDAILQHTVTPAELRAFGERAQIAARLAIQSLDCKNSPENLVQLLHPGESQCKWCPAKATCPALARHVTDTVFEAFETDNETPRQVPADTEALGLYRNRIGLIEDWCKAIAAEVYARTERGEMPGWKLVAGRRGARKWKDENAVEELFSSFRLKLNEKYDFTLISPTKAEKFLTPKRWEKACALVTQEDGKPKAVPEDAPGEPIVRGPMFECATENVSNGDLIL